MKRLFASLFSVLPIVLGGCVAVPYDTDSLYYPAYASTVTTQAYGGYYYPDSGYPYAVPRYSQPYSYYPYPYHQPPVYTPPAPIIVPSPSLEFRYNRNARPGWENHAPSGHDQFRTGPRPDWNRPGVPEPRGEPRDNGRRDWQQRNWQPHGNGGNDWQGGRPPPAQPGFPREGFRQR